MVDHKLYRYRSLETARDYENAVKAICENKLYFPSPLKFNDPFDSKPLVTSEELTDQDWEKILRKQFQKLVPVEFENRKVRDLIGLGLHKKIEIRRKIVDENLEKIGICSFSKSNNDILMWSHYSNGHRGYCLEFDPNKNSEFFESVKPVIYQEEHPTIKPEVDNEGNLKFDYVELINSLLTKSDRWCYEDEFRILNSDEGSKYYTFLPESLTGIILGAKMSDQNKTIIQSLNCKRKSPVQIIDAKLKEKEFGIEV